MAEGRGPRAVGWQINGARAIQHREQLRNGATARAASAPRFRDHPPCPGRGARLALDATLTFHHSLCHLEVCVVTSWPPPPPQPPPPPPSSCCRAIRNSSLDCHMGQSSRARRPVTRTTGALASPLCHRLFARLNTIDQATSHAWLWPPPFSTSAHEVLIVASTAHEHLICSYESASPPALGRTRPQNARRLGPI